MGFNSKFKGLIAASSWLIHLNDVILLSICAVKAAVKVTELMSEILLLILTFLQITRANCMILVSVLYLI
jgi:hypothetical protein